MKTILAPVDFSPITTRVVAEAAALARAHDGRVVLLHVVAPPHVAFGYEGSTEFTVALGEQEGREAERELEAMAEELEEDYTRADAVRLDGMPVAVILRQAKRLPADYIVMGSHGHGALHDLLAGGTASGVMKAAPCPVVIVPARGQVSEPARRGRRG